MAIKWFLWAGLLIAWAAPAQAREFHARETSGGEAALIRRLERGNGKGWVLERGAVSFRGQTYLDGLILVSAGSSLKVKGIRRQDGDHQLLLGKEGKPGQPIQDLKKWIPAVRREHLVEYRLTDVPGRWGALAYLYVPYGATVTASASSGEALIQVSLPWEQRPTFPFDSQPPPQEPPEK